MPLTRREMCVLLPTMLAATRGATTIRGATAEKPETADSVLQSAIYDLKNLPVDENTGVKYAPVFEGKTYTGERIRLHETMVAPGKVAHSLGRNMGDEIFLVWEGVVEVEIEGKVSHLGPGSVAYVAWNAEHAIRNTGKEWARYFVLLLGSPLG